MKLNVMGEVRDFEVVGEDSSSLLLIGCSCCYLYNKTTKELIGVSGVRNYKIKDVEVVS